jgi:ribosomal 50S subunit-recycling heat shock protein
VGDVLTITLGLKVRVVRVLAFVDRRGSPSEASGLYEEVSGPPSQDPSP